MPALFIICPDCHLEQKIRDEHPDCFFVDALGGAVYSHSLDIKASIEHLFHTADITEIFIAIRDSCRLVDHDFSKPSADSESIQLSKYPLHLAKVESYLLQKNPPSA